tara:strand:+ start:433 stop:747 length:315 start_codon:yes stop_codon:yes gene_type:complete
MKGFDKVDKLYLSTEGEQLASKIDHSYYRQTDYVSLPISPILRGEDFWDGVYKAIENLDFIYWTEEHNGTTYKLQRNEDNSFSLQQKGRIVQMQTKGEESDDGE